jgi:hypothetical protein
MHRRTRRELQAPPAVPPSAAATQAFVDRVAQVLASPAFLASLGTSLLVDLLAAAALALSLALRLCCTLPGQRSFTS